MAEYDARWGADFRLTHYGADVIEAFVILPWWSGLSAKIVQDSKTSWQVEPMLQSIKDAVNLPMPDPAAPDVCADIIAKRANNPDKAIFSLMLAPLDILYPLRLSGLYTDMLDYPDVIHDILRRVRPVLIEAARRVCEQDIDVLYLAGDICGRNGAMVSPKHLQEFLFDYVSDVIGIAHEMGKKVFYHSDGYVLDILDLYMEYGIDGCNPVEPRYNDAKEFVRRSNGKLALYGGLDNCNIIPNGTVEEVREHVRNQFEILSESGLIFSTHDIPGTCPRENLDAMVGAIKACAWNI
ncbi:MAG TPA: uroporphyrinogen decarboxylase family protein [Armatimonadota bacterium]|nr:uroporphyrinogen decarboxylase family protein [Armatimonadota bacterium]